MSLDALNTQGTISKSSESQEEERRGSCKDWIQFCKETVGAEEMIGEELGEERNYATYGGGKLGKGKVFGM